MLFALLLAAQVAGAETLATCRAPDDSQQRTWSLARRDGAYLVVFRSRALDQPQVELRLPGVSPLVGAGETRVSFTSANGGRSLEWRIAKDDSTLDLYVNHGLEVNVEADLDPAVDLMNTEGPIAVQCAHLAEAVDPTAKTPSSGVPEWQVSIGLARSVNLFQSAAGRSYAVQTIGWGRELTQEWGPGLLRGRFVWAVEAMPVFAQFSPSSIYGIGVAPVVWRWNFTPQPQWSGFAELAMGGMWSSEAIPEGTSRGNFTAHWGAGVRLRPRGRHALLLAYRFQHFSNGNQLGSNPGVNAHVVLLGWSHRS
jgi:opacity protein-like surface antigen